MQKQDIIEQIIVEIENQGFDVIGDDSFPLDAISNIRKKITIFSPTIATAFKMAHELMHIINHDDHRCGECDSTSPQEKRANKGAILKLWDIFENHEGTTEDISRFIETTGCPEKLTKIVVLKSKIKTWDKEDVQEQVNEYIIHSDEDPMSWNLYRIMDACHIDYKWEQLVKEILFDNSSDSMRLA